jgi:hypothetical protein
VDLILKGRQAGSCEWEVEGKREKERGEKERRKLRGKERRKQIVMLVHVCVYGRLCVCLCI